MSKPISLDSARTQRREEKVAALTAIIQGIEELKEMAEGHAFSLTAYLLDTALVEATNELQGLGEGGASRSDNLQGE